MEVDKFRLHWGGAIIVLAMAAMLLALMIILYRIEQTTENVPTILALIGGVTTFLSAVVGVFFGVSASSGAGAQGAEAMVAAGKAGAAAADAAKVAGDAAAQAATASSEAVAASREIAASARQVAQSAERSLEHVQMRSGAPHPPEPAVASEAAEEIEVLRFDPGAPATTLSVPRGLDRFFSHIFAPQPATGPAAGADAGLALFQRTIKVAQAEAAAGVSRASNRPRVAEYLALLGFDFADAAGKPVPFCAAGLTWATCRAICDTSGIAYTDANRLAVFRGVLGEVARFFKPSASCKAILDDARARGTLVPQPMPGYLVLYNWSGGAHPEHIGLVLGATGSTLSTVEFNTSAAGSQSDGGAVAQKTRDRKYAIGYIRTYPAGAARDAGPTAFSGPADPPDTGPASLPERMRGFITQAESLLGQEAAVARGPADASGPEAVDPATALPQLSDLLDSLGTAAPQGLLDEGEALLAGLRRDVGAREPVDARGRTAVSPDYDRLRDDYLALFESCKVRPEYEGQVAWHLRKIVAGKDAYERVARVTRVPWAFIGIVHGLEASFRFTGHLHNGDPLAARTVNVPAGRPPVWNPPNDWDSSAIDALEFEKFTGLSDWSLPRMLYRWERYNGFGSRRQKINTPYLWSFSNHYAKGKYVRDHVWNPDAVSKQCGAAVMLRALIDQKIIPEPPRA